MIAAGRHRQFDTDVRRLQTYSNLLLVLTQQSYYARRVYVGELFPLPFIALLSYKFGFLLASESIICSVLIVSYRS